MVHSTFKNMWSPTHVQLLVKQAKGLNVKGKGGTNDAFVTISLGKEKFQTSVKEKTTDPVEWNEQCELKIPSQGNTAEVILTVFHRSFIGVDEFLGHLVLPLNQFDVYERPKSKSYQLKCKPGKNKTDYRGELEVILGFTVKANNDKVGGSVADISKKSKGSISSVNKVAGSISGSLLSIGSKEKKNIKKYAKSVAKRVDKVGDKAKISIGSSLKLNKESKLDVLPEASHWQTFDRTLDKDNFDPGVNSDEEEGFNCRDSVSYRSSSNSLQSKDTESNDGRSSRRGSGRRVSRSSSGRSTRTSGRSTGTPFIKSSRGLPTSVTMGALSAINFPSSFDPPTPGQEEFTEKLIGKKAMTSVSGSEQSRVSQLGLPTYNEATESRRSDKEGSHPKKKIIPVHSDDDDSSPDPQNLNRSPMFRLSQSSFNLTRQEDGELVKKKKSLGLKLKTSYSFMKKEEIFNDRRRNSVESNHSRQSRTYSDSSLGPPNGSRVVLRRERSPGPDLPHEVLARFNGKTREDLIEMVVDLQFQHASQDKRISDLEDYIDSLLLRVLEVAPILLKHPSPVINKEGLR